MSDDTKFTFLDTICFRVVQWGFLSRFKAGCFTLIFPDKTKKSYGDLKSDMRVDMHIIRPRIFKMFVLRESIGLAEGYMAGDWTTEDLTKFTSLVIEQDKAGVAVGVPILKTIEIFIRKILLYLFRNDAHHSLSNVQQHYDLGNDLYANMLDPSTFSYTCGLYRDPKQLIFPSHGQFGESAPGTPIERPLETISLDQAQLNKIHYVIEKGNIKKTDRVLELGCGFGGFSCETAKKTGARVDAYNLSVEQLALARERAKKAGVDHLINYVHDDYRNCVKYDVDHKTNKMTPTDKESNMARKYDVIVSIGMLEHVGHYDLPTFFQTAWNMLKPGGTLVVHTITSCEHAYEAHKVTYGFIQKFIFPGACIPPVGAVVDAAVWQGKFELQHFDNIGENYAPTLRHWRENFYKNLDKVKAIKDSEGKPMYDTSFLRMWDFYLCNCEAEFLTGHYGLGQFIFKCPSTEYRLMADQDKIMKPLLSLQLPDEGSEKQLPDEGSKKQLPDEGSKKTKQTGRSATNKKTK